MKKKEFLEELEEYLIGIPKSDKEEILQDYEDHFKIGKKKKRSEEDIIKSLGDPRKIARAVRFELASSAKTELQSEAIEAWVEAKKFTRYLFNEITEGIGNVFQSRNNVTYDKTPLWIFIFLILGVISLISKNGFFLVVTLLLFAYITFKDFKQKKNKRISPRTWLILALIMIAVLFKQGLFFIIAIFLGAYFLFKAFKDKKSIKADNLKVSSKKGVNKKKSTRKVVLSLVFNFFFFIWLWIFALFAILGIFISSLALFIGGIAIIVFAIVSINNYATSMIKEILLAGLFSGFGILILGGLFVWLCKEVAKYFFLLTKKYIKLNMRFIRK